MKDILLSYLAARLQEPSTYVSLGTMLAGIGVVIAPEYWQLIMGAAMGLGGALGAVLRERAKTTPQEIKAVVQQTVERDVLKPNVPDAVLAQAVASAPKPAV